jgi:hypothetical protein
MTRVTSHHILMWTCDRCGGEHRVRLREDHVGNVLRVDHHRLNEVFTMESPLAVSVEEEVVYEVTGGMDGNCLDVTPAKTTVLVKWDAATKRRIYDAIGYTVLDPDERAAAIRAVEREMRGF